MQADEELGESGGDGDSESSRLVGEEAHMGPGSPAFGDMDIRDAKKSATELKVLPKALTCCRTSAGLLALHYAAGRFCLGHTRH